MEAEPRGRRLKIFDAARFEDGAEDGRSTCVRLTFIRRRDYRNNTEVAEIRAWGFRRRNFLESNDIQNDRQLLPATTFDSWLSRNRVLRL